MWGVLSSSTREGLVSASGSGRVQVPRAPAPPPQTSPRWTPGAHVDVKAAHLPRGSTAFLSTGAELAGPRRPQASSALRKCCHQDVQPSSATSAFTHLADGPLGPAQSTWGPCLAAARIPAGWSLLHHLSAFPGATARAFSAAIPPWKSPGFTLTPKYPQQMGKESLAVSSLVSLEHSTRSFQGFPTG